MGAHMTAKRPRALHTSAPCIGRASTRTCTMAALPARVASSASSASSACEPARRRHRVAPPRDQDSQDQSLPAPGPFVLLHRSLLELCQYWTPPEATDAFLTWANERFRLDARVPVLNPVTLENAFRKETHSAVRLYDDFANAGLFDEQQAARTAAAPRAAPGARARATAPVTAAQSTCTR